MHIYGLNRNKSPLKISGKVTVEYSGTPENFQGIYMAHRAVHFAMAQLSCYYYYHVNLNLYVDYDDDVDAHMFRCIVRMSI